MFFNVLVYSMRAGKFSQIGISFTNPVPASLSINSLSLIIESYQDQTKFAVELVTADDRKQTSFEIPAMLNEQAIIQMGYVFEHLGKFQIIGYEINIWNDSNRILFKDLVHESDPKLKSKLQNSMTTTTVSLQSSYDIEFFPEIPIVNKVKFLARDPNDNLELIDTLSEIKTAQITAGLGICQEFLLTLEFVSEKFNDIEIEQSSCFVLNESNLGRFKASVSIANTKDTCTLIVDSTQVNLDTSTEDPSCLDLPCMLELKYSNKSGRDQNLCHSLRKQILIKLLPMVSAKIINITSIE